MFKMNDLKHHDATHQERASSPLRIDRQTANAGERASSAHSRVRSRTPSPPPPPPPSASSSSRHKSLSRARGTALRSSARAACVRATPRASRSGRARVRRRHGGGQGRFFVRRRRRLAARRHRHRPDGSCRRTGRAAAGATRLAPWQARAVHRPRMEYSARGSTQDDDARKTVRAWDTSLVSAVPAAGFDGSRTAPDNHRCVISQQPHEQPAARQLGAMCQSRYLVAFSRSSFLGLLLLRIAFLCLFRFCMPPPVFSTPYPGFSRGLTTHPKNQRPPKALFLGARW